MHLLVIYLEYRAVQEILGELRARQVMEFWAGDHYTWLYRTVLDHARQIGEVVAKNRLLPGAPTADTAPHAARRSSSGPS